MVHRQKWFYGKRKKAAGIHSDLLNPSHGGINLSPGTSAPKARLRTCNPRLISTQNREDLKHFHTFLVCIYHSTRAQGFWEERDTLSVENKQVIVASAYGSS